MTQISLSKTNYILYRECPKNTWLKVHKPDVYFNSPLSPFELSIIETGNEVELVARELFPTGVLVDKDKSPIETTQSLLESKVSVIFQATFEKAGYYAASDILKYNPDTNDYSLYEVKASNDIDEKIHLYDLAFQVSVLKRAGLSIRDANIIHLNREYVREGDIDIVKVFVVKNQTGEIEALMEKVEEEMTKALAYINQSQEPVGYCSCVYKGRSSHCTTFSYSNPDIPAYGIHDLTRIGLSKKKLIELVDGNNLTFDRVPSNMEFSDAQKNQLSTYLLDSVIHEEDRIKEEFAALVFPLYFLDYETFPSALPRFNNYSPYDQIPFQYSLHILRNPEEEPEHLDFIYTKSGDPSVDFVNSLKKHIGPVGSVIVWHKGFECGRNRELGRRVPEAKNFLDELDKRIFDLEDIFKKQYHVHKDFKGSSSIKKVLPVLVPELSYKELEIQEGGTAADTWNKIITGEISGKERDSAILNLREYCKLDTYAMYAIWKKLYELIS